MNTYHHIPSKNYNTTHTKAQRAEASIAVESMHLPQRSHTNAEETPIHHNALAFHLQNPAHANWYILNFLTDIQARELLQSIKEYYHVDLNLQFTQSTLILKVTRNRWSAQRKAHLEQLDMQIMQTNTYRSLRNTNTMVWLLSGYVDPQTRYDIEQPTQQLIENNAKLQQMNQHEACSKGSIALCTFFYSLITWPLIGMISDDNTTQLICFLAVATSSMGLYNALTCCHRREKKKSINALIEELEHEKSEYTDTEYQLFEPTGSLNP